MSNGFKDLIVWQKSIDLCIRIYRLTAKFPSSEQYSIISQLRRAISSVPANIAEGCARFSKKEFTHFLWIAYGSLAEVDTFLIISQKLGFVKEADLVDINELKEEIRKMIKTLIKIQN